MKSDIHIDAEQPEKVQEVLEPAFTGSSKVKHQLSASESQIEIKTEAETLGQLRGATDSVFRLSGLAKKILER